MGGVATLVYSKPSFGLLELPVLWDLRGLLLIWHLLGLRVSLLSSSKASSAETPVSLCPPRASDSKDGIWGAELCGALGRTGLMPQFCFSWENEPYIMRACYYINHKPIGLFWGGVIGIDRRGFWKCPFPECKSDHAAPLLQAHGSAVLPGQSSHSSS